MKLSLQIILTTVFVLVIHNHVMAQNNVADSVRFYLINTSNWENTDRVKLEYNQKLLHLLKRELPMLNLNDLQKDSIMGLGIVESQDKKVGIITWQLQNQMGVSSFFGFIIHRSNDNVSLFGLNNNKVNIEKAFFEVYSKENWFGALYYEIIDVDINGNKAYTLLGLDPKDIHSNRKVIDILSFDKNGEPIFGHPIFLRGRSKALRIVFEYTEKANMLLRYDSKVKMIVFDHLSPISYEYNGDPRFYGPDFSYDALKFVNGNWVYMNDIDIRNPEQKGKSQREIQRSW